MTFSIVSNNTNNNQGAPAVLAFGNIPVYSYTPGINAFAINSATGRVSAATWLDYEAMVGSKYYMVYVHLTDNGSPSLYTEIVMKIHIQDMNDAPVLISAPAFTWPEETFNTTYWCSPCDWGKNDTVNCSLLKCPINGMEVKTHVVAL